MVTMTSIMMVKMMRIISTNNMFICVIVPSAFLPKDADGTGECVDETGHSGASTAHNGTQRKAKYKLQAKT